MNLLEEFYDLLGTEVAADAAFECDVDIERTDFDHLVASFTMGDTVVRHEVYLDGMAEAGDLKTLVELELDVLHDLDDEVVEFVSLRKIASSRGSRGRIICAKLTLHHPLKRIEHMNTTTAPTAAEIKAVVTGKLEVLRGLSTGVRKYEAQLIADGWSAADAASLAVAMMTDFQSQLMAVGFNARAALGFPQAH